MKTKRQMRKTLFTIFMSLLLSLNISIAFIGEVIVDASETVSELSSSVPDKAALGQTRATLYAGERMTLAINNLPENSTVKWTSDRKSVAKVNSRTGRVAAVKKGTAKIKAKVTVPGTVSSPAQSYTLTCKLTVKAQTKNVQSISTTAQLKAALAGSGGCYKLTAAIKGADSGIKVAKGTHRLDLNGYTITGKNSESSIILVNGGTLTLIDSRATGGITNTNNQDAVGCSSGKLIINGGTYKGHDYAVFIEGGATTINQGSFTGEMEAIRITKGNLTVNGGSIITTNKEFLSYGLNIVGSGKMDIVINGGKIVGNDAVIVSGNLSCSLSIKNGEFTGKWNALASNGCNLDISGGRFIATEGIGIGLSPWFSAINCKISGGTVIAATNAVEIQNETNLTVTGGRFEVTDTENNVQLYIYETYTGKKELKNGVIQTISDNTPDGLGLIATEFKNNGSKYKKDMYIDDTDTLYSVMMDITEQLLPSYSFRCSEDVCDVYNFYLHKWTDGMTKDTNSSSGQSDFYDDKTFFIKGTTTYQLRYEIIRITDAPSVIKNASVAAKKYNKMLDSIVEAKVTDEMSAAEKVTAIHDYIVKNYTYDHSFAEDSFEFYGLLDNKKGVCQAYARLFELLVMKCGVPVACVTGVGGEPGKNDWDLHMWNVVKIDGEELYVDTTFDDGMGSKKFLLKTEDEFYGYGYHRR